MVLTEGRRAKIGRTEIDAAGVGGGAYVGYGEAEEVESLY